MTPGQTVIFAVGLSFLIFLLAGDYSASKLRGIKGSVTG